MSVSALCVGHAAWDLCIFVDAYPAENSKTEIGFLIESGGGPAANAAWLLGHWGVPTAFAAVVGRDDFGRKAVKELVDAGVDCRLVEQRTGTPRRSHSSSSIATPVPELWLTAKCPVPVCV